MKNLLNITDLNKKDIYKIIDFSEKLYFKNDPILLNKNIGLIFEKLSTRTRISFHVGIQNLHGSAININLNELNLNRYESFEDTFEILSLYLDCIIFRTDEHTKLELAAKYFKKPIINALSNLSHPCQAIADIYTLYKHFNRIDNFTICWFGDINNVLISLIEVTDLLDNITINIFTDRKIHESKSKNLDKYKNLNFNYEIKNELINKSDCIMTDVYKSMNDKEDKGNLLKRFQINHDIMKHTKDNAVFMHCLPANIGSEVTLDVLKGPKSIVLKQAENRLHAQKGILKWLNI